MLLSAGSRLGPFEIVAPLGAGGMGEVYRARDSRMGREVAVKISAEQFSERFDREVRAVAALNHPNICTLYDVGPNYLVMELVEGPTLADRLRQGALSLNEVFAVARQIADALVAAHEKGIVHRDLKPANIKIKPDGSVKVLDFGLAKMTDPEAPRGSPELSPTLTLEQATRVGMILGTAGYMAPEQARGEPVDQRADIWAFGVVLHEMLTGRRLYEGRTVSDTLAAVLIKDPDLEPIPLQLRPLLRRCLAKEPKQRLHSAADLRLLLDEAAEAPAPTPAITAAPPVRSARIPWLVAAVAVLAAAVLGFIHFREQPPTPEVMRFQIPPPGRSDLASPNVILSPDGRNLAFEAPGPAGTTQLWVRSFESLQAKPLAGTDNPANIFFWSPDSRFLAFAVAGKLKKVEVSGDVPETVCEYRGAWRGGAWSSRGTIIFGTQGFGLWRVAESGGTPAPLTVLDGSRGETAHAQPTFLPDGKHFLYVRFTSGIGNNGVYAGSLDTASRQQSTTRLVTVDAGIGYAPAQSNSRAPGHILFTREGSLLAQPFDENKLVLAGDPVPVAEGLTRLNPPPFSVSRTGVLAYWAGAAATRRLTWFDRAGHVLGTVGEPGDYNSVSLAPDGTRAAVMRTEAGNTDIWVVEFARGISTRLTFDPALDALPVWSPDGSRIIFTSGRQGPLDLYQKAANGVGAEATVYKSNEPNKLPQDWSRDGRFLLYSMNSDGRDHLWVLPLQGEKTPRPYLKTEFYESQGRFSPDGRYVAYASDSSGRLEVYVQPFPMASAGKWQISRGGGVAPRWRRDGKELFYISADSQMMAVDVSTAPTFTVDIPKPLFHAPIFGGGSAINVTRYDVAADGKQFLINAVAAEGGALTPITVVFNWEAALKR